MTNIVRFIGDIHGKIYQYKNIINNCNQSIQVGDFGVGFVDIPEMELNHKFIRGNHDNPALCKLNPNYIVDGTYNTDTQMMFIGGANSIDKERRTPGVNWWYDEELSYLELVKLVEEYKIKKPSIMITHTPSNLIAKLLFTPKYLEHTVTATALDFMLDEHRPKLWIFGHWHESKDVIVDGTRFICLKELEYIDIDISGYMS